MKNMVPSIVISRRRFLNQAELKSVLQRGWFYAQQFPQYWVFCRSASENGGCNPRCLLVRAAQSNFLRQSSWCCFYGSLYCRYIWQCFFISVGRTLQLSKSFLPTRSPVNLYFRMQLRILEILKSSAAEQEQVCCLLGAFGERCWYPKSAMILR